MSGRTSHRLEITHNRNQTLNWPDEIFSHDALLILTFESGGLHIKRREESRHAQASKRSANLPAQ